MSSNTSARPTTPVNSVEAKTARAKRRAILEKGLAPTRKRTEMRRPSSTHPTFLSGTHRPPSGGLAHGYYPSKEAQRQTLFELDMLTAFDETEFDEELIDYLEEEEEIVEEPAAKRLKKEEPQ